MRREFILLLLGIICMSTISSLLSGYVQIASEKVLLDTVVGAVGAGNFSYWQLGHTGPLLVELTSLSGDADLYVSDTVRPSYEVDKNNFSSATCGNDLVNIPPDFPRPIGIGVFGYWSSALSEYSIQVFLDTTSAQSYGHRQLFQRGQAEKPEVEKRGGGGGGGGAGGKEPVSARRTDDERPRYYLRLISILDAIFDMFVL